MEEHQKDYDGSKFMNSMPTVLQKVREFYAYFRKLPAGMQQE
jgi:hypothetical protein